MLTEVGDNQSLLLSLKESQYFSHFKDRATVWENRLVMLDDVLHLLNPIQRKWVYLEPIFGRGALPHEQARSLCLSLSLSLTLSLPPLSLSLTLSPSLCLSL